MAGPKTAKVVLRGGFTCIDQWAPLATTVPFGIIPAASMGINFPATLGVAPWDATLAGTTTSLMTPSTSLAYYSAVGIWQDTLAVTTTTAPGPRWINFLGSLYGLGYGAASVLTDAGSSYTINASAVLKSPLQPGGTFSQSLTFNIGTGGTAGLAQSQDSSGTVSWTEDPSSWSTPTTVGAIWNSAANTNELKFSNLGFSIPSGVTIVGVKVAVTASGSPTVAPVDSSAELVGGTGTPTNLANYNQQLPNVTVNNYGSATQLWGMTWTPAQINNTAFGFNWQLSNNTGANKQCIGFYASAESFTVTVYYQALFITTAPVAQTGYPTGAVDITQYQSRLWLACGCDVPGSGTYHEPTTIFWTNPVTSTNPLLNTSADWRYTDPVSGITSTNKVVIDNNGSDPIMGFGRVTGAMIIFRRSSVYVLKGTTTANYQITKVSGNIGCLDPRSIVESDEGVYFMSLEGLMLTNGAKITSVSTGVEQALQSALAYQQSVVLGGNANPQSGWISSGITSQGHIAVSVGVIGTSACAMLPMPGDVGATLAPTAMRTLWSGVYDPDVGSWYRLTSFLFGIDSGLWNPSTFVGVPDLPQIFVSNRLVSQRSLHVVGNAGITMLEDQALNASYLNGGALYDSVKTGGTGSSSPEVGVIQGLDIPARWHTRMAPIVGTTTLDRRWGMPKRFFLDHTMSVSGSGTAAQNYDTTASMTGYLSTLTSLAGAGTAWTVTTPASALLPTTTLESNTPVGTAALTASASTNVLTMIPPAMGTIPAGATITGVQVVLYKNGGPANSLGGPVTLFNDTIQLYNAGAAIGTAYTEPQWQPGAGFFGYGNSSFLWGTALTPAIINSGTFGVAVTATNIGGVSGDVVVYLANIIVYYTTAGGAMASVTAPSWVVTPYDSDGAAYPVSLSCSLASSSAPTDPRNGPSIVAPVTGNTILRENLDFNNEMANLTYDISLPAIQSYTSALSGTTVIGPSVALAPFTNVIGEVYGIGTEYQWAHDLRSKVN